jgi:AsmA-like C-terminal region/AsmA family
VQTTLLGLAIAFILALVAALIGPYFIDWNQFRPQFEAEATRVIGAPVRVRGELDARLLPTPSLRLRSVVVGGANDLGKVQADKLDVEFSLGSLMRGEWRADELTINGMSLDLGLDAQGRVDWPASSGKFNLGSLAIDRLNLTGRIALHDAASRGTIELKDIAFSGDVRSLAGAVRGDGNFMLSGVRYPFRVSSGQSADGNGTRVHLNVDPGARALSVDLDGVLSFEGRAPRFDGAMLLATPPGLKAEGNVPITPWRISTRIKADPTAARLEQLEASYGPEERALKFVGGGEVRLGASPLLRATLSARQLDADRFGGKDGGRDAAVQEPARLLPALRALTADIPLAPIPSQIEINVEQIMLAGRPVQNLAADLRSDNGFWRIERLDLRAPGATLVSLNSARAQPGLSAFAGALSVESADPDTLVAWLQGRAEVSYRSRKPLRLQGNVTMASGHLSFDALRAEIDGGGVEGRVGISDNQAGGSRLEAELKGEHLDLDAAAAFARSIAGPQREWPDDAVVSINLGRATSAGQEFQPFAAKIGYGPNKFFIDQFSTGTAGGATLQGSTNFDRVNGTGKLILNSSAASARPLIALIAPFAPAAGLRLDAIGTTPGPALLKLVVDLQKSSENSQSVDARAVLDIDTPQLKGAATFTATPDAAGLRGFDLDALGRSEFSIDSKLSSDHGRTLVALLGLDGTIAATEGPARFEGSVAGAWRAPLRLKAKLSGAGLDAEVQGTAEPWASEPKASVNLAVRGVSFAPLLDLKPGDVLAQKMTMSSRLSLTRGRVTLDDLDSSIAGSRLRGRLAMTLEGERTVDGEVGLDSLDIAPAFALAIGAAGHDASEPLGAGLLKGWRGRVAFQALRGLLPGGGELRPLSGALKSDGQTLIFDAIKGGIGGGEATATVEAKRASNGIALNARVQLSGVEGSAMRYGSLAMPAGRTSMQLTLSSQGRSASALTGALLGTGTVTLESARVAGLDARVFETAIRASDTGQATDDAKLRQVIEPVLSAGGLSVKSAQIPFSIADGRLRVGATTLEADEARAIISGGYDIPADQADIRVSLSSTAATQLGSRPEIQLFAAGPPGALHRTIDVGPLSSWLAVRAIDRETRRLDSLERGEPAPATASIPPAAAPVPSVATPEAGLSASVPQTPGRDPRRLAPKPRLNVPRPTAGPPASSPPIVSQQLAPLPPPVEIRPPPAVIARPPKPKPPLVLMPPADTSMR